MPNLLPMPEHMFSHYCAYSLCGVNACTCTAAHPLQVSRHVDACILLPRASSSAVEHAKNCMLAQLLACGVALMQRGFKTPVLLGMRTCLIMRLMSTLAYPSLCSTVRCRNGLRAAVVETGNTAQL